MTDCLFQASVAAHQNCEFPDAFQRERQGTQRLEGDAHKLHGIVIRGNAVGTEHSAPAAPMDNGPSTVFRTHTATSAIMPPQSANRPPGSISKCKLDKQLGQ